MKERVALDSNVVTYFTDILTAGYDPALDNDQLSEQKIAMLRLMFYCDHSYYITQSVVGEYQKIPNQNELLSTKRKHDIFLRDVDNAASDELIKLLNAIHPQTTDCQIYAECVANDIGVLLTCDKALVKKLGNYDARLKLVTPQQFWIQQNIVRGAIPLSYPAESNPYHKNRFWVW